MKTDNLLTKGKFDELQKKLGSLKNSRLAAAAEVSRLAELGDFSENVEYQLAKGRLRGINHSILKIEHQLNQANVIPKPRQNIRVEVGHVVTVIIDNEEKSYQILGSSETDPQKGIISRNSPIGAVLLGHKVGESVNVRLGSKDAQYTIVGIK